MNPTEGQFDLYHGSQASMKPGTVVKPGADKLAWATTNLDTASHFANQGHSLEAKTGQGKWTQPAMFNPVYKVNPVNPRDVKNDYYNKGYSASPSGFTVEKVHSFTSPKELQQPSSEQRAQLQKVMATRKSGI